MAGTGTCPTLAKLLLGVAGKDEVGMGGGGGGWVHSYSHVPRRNPLNVIDIEGCGSPDTFFFWYTIAIFAVQEHFNISMPRPSRGGMLTCTTTVLTYSLHSL